MASDLKQVVKGFYEQLGKVKGVSLTFRQTRAA